MQNGTFKYILKCRKLCRIRRIFALNFTDVFSKLKLVLAQDAVTIPSLILVNLLTHRHCGTVSVPSGSLQVQENWSQLHQGPAGVLAGRPVQPNCADCRCRRCHLRCPGSHWQEQRKLSSFTRPSSAPQAHLPRLSLTTYRKQNTLLRIVPAAFRQRALCPATARTLKYESIRLFLPV